MLKNFKQPALIIQTPQIQMFEKKNLRKVKFQKKYNKKKHYYFFLILVFKVFEVEPLKQNILE